MLGAGGDAVSTVVAAVIGVAGGVFGIVTILILTFYMLVESETIFRRFVRLFPIDQRLRIATVSSDITVKVSAWLGGDCCRPDHRQHGHRWPVADRRSVFLRARAALRGWGS